MLKPEPCGKCGAEPEVRKTCGKCGEAVWVLHHTEHYMGGSREIVPCRCSKSGSKEVERARWEKKKARITRDTGKVFEPGKFRPVTTSDKAKKVAEGLAAGLSATQALREADYPPATVNRANGGINKKIRAEFRKLGRKYIEMGRDLTPEDQEAMVRGRLMEATILRSDKGVQAAKQLGADKRISMWQPDAQAGMVILQAPPIPKIDHEVPLFRVEHLLPVEHKAQAKDEEEPVALASVAEPRPEASREDEDMSDRQARRERH